MPDESNSFGKTAEKLSRNPLGIIALFIVLAHAFASLILAFSNRLQYGQQWALIGFVVLFPVIVLSIFTYLVIRHHIKLYAPADFRSDESFLKSITPEQLKSDNEIKVELGHIDLITTASISTSNTGEDNKQIIENGSQNSQTQRSNLAKTYLIAEDFALRRIETSFNEPVRRQAVVTAPSESIKFDGIILQKDLVTGIEVLYSKVANITMDRVDPLIHKAFKANEYLLSLGRRFNFLLVIVIDDNTTRDFELEKALKSKVIDRINSKYKLAFMNISIEVLDFELLKKEFSGIII